jgi:hypothetical protein
VFLSIDGFQHLDLSSTLWAWPGQNPLFFSDPTGHGPIGGAIGAAVGAFGGVALGGLVGTGEGALVGAPTGPGEVVTIPVGAILGGASGGTAGFAAGAKIGSDIGDRLWDIAKNLVDGIPKQNPANDNAIPRGSKADECAKVGADAFVRCLDEKGGGCGEEDFAECQEVAAEAEQDCLDNWLQLVP